MKRRRGIVVVTAVVVAIAATIVFLDASRGSDPRSLDRMLRNPGLNFIDLPFRVAELGTNALPELVDAVDWEPGPFQRFANAHQFPNQPAIDRRLEIWRTSNPAFVHEVAGRLLACFGRDAAPVLPRLHAIAALAGTVPVSTGVLVALLDAAPHDPDTGRAMVAALGGSSREQAVEAACLSRTIPSAEVTQAVVAALRTNWTVRPELGARFVLRAGHGADALVPFLLQSLASGDGTEATANALAAIRPPPRDVAASLEVAMAAAKPGTIPRTSAPRFLVPCNLFVALGINGIAFENVLAERVTNVVPLERILAARSLAAIHGRPAECVEALVREMRGRSPVDSNATFTPLDTGFVHPSLGAITLPHRETAAWLLGELGTNAIAAVPALRGAAMPASGWVPVIASWSLWRITRDRNEALPGVARALDSEDPWQRHFALRAVLEMGPAAAVLEPKIRACALRDIRHYRDAADALAAIHR